MMMQRYQSAIKPTSLCILMFILSSLAGCTGQIDGTSSTNSTTGGDSGSDGNISGLGGLSNPLAVTLVLEGTPTTDTHSIVAVATPTGGLMPYTYAWTIDGVAPTIMPSERYDAGTLTAGQHTISLTITDARGDSESATVLFALQETPTSPVDDGPNAAPQVMIMLPASVYVGESADWGLQIVDPDDDDVTVIVSFADGTTSTETSGSHVWTTPGTYRITVTATDSEGASVTKTADILVAHDLPPDISVTSETSVLEGDVILSPGDTLEIAIQATDDRDDLANLNLDWGEGQSMVIQPGTFTHTYASVGTYTITITASDGSGMTSTWIRVVEVIAEFEDSRAFELLEQILPEDDAIESEIDEDGDGVVDGAEDAEKEEGYDWESDFDENQDGQPGHDGGQIDGWQAKDEEGVLGVAQSDTTAGGGRSDDGESDDPLTDTDAHVTENETSTEVDNASMNDHGEVMDDLFEGTEDELDDSANNVVADPDYYTGLANATSGLIWRTTDLPGFDVDGDGTPDADCSRNEGILWRDSNQDGNPERAILLRILECSRDNNGDGVDDQFYTEVEALNLSDYNSNGQFEVLEALHLTSMSWINGTLQDTNNVVRCLTFRDWNEDGNPEFSLIMILVNREFDDGQDGSIEVTINDAQILSVRDWNSDGVPNEMFIFMGHEMSWDMDGDGNANYSSHHAHLLHAFDRDQDGNPDDVRAAQFGGEVYDNNSDGSDDSWTNTWLGVRTLDRNLDGNFDKVIMAIGHERVDDSDGDGNSESSLNFFAASMMSDWNQDGNVDRMWAFHMVSDGTDLDDDGSWDYKNETVASVEAMDWNSDGTFDHYTGLRVFSLKADHHPNGWGSETNHIWILEVWDWNSDGTPNAVHAVVVTEVMWDNNTDGHADTKWVDGKLWHGVDFNDDQNMERHVYFEINDFQSDDDADGNIEFSITEVTIHTRNTTLQGNVQHEYFFHAKGVKANVSAAGVPQYTNDTVVAYESWNTSQRQETHAMVVIVEKHDHDRDGTVEAETVHLFADNRS